MKNLKDAETKSGKNSAFGPTGIMAPSDSLTGLAEEVAKKAGDDDRKDVEPTK